MLILIVNPSNYKQYNTSLIHHIYHILMNILNIHTLDDLQEYLIS